MGAGEKVDINKSADGGGEPLFETFILMVVNRAISFSTKKAK